MYKWLLICSQTCTWIANNADCTNKTHIAGAAVMMPLFLQTPTSSPLSSSLLWSRIQWNSWKQWGSLFEDVFSTSCWIEYQSLSTSWPRVHEVESRARTLWADERLREPDQRENQTKSEWARMCESKPECARVSQREQIAVVH